MATDRSAVVPLSPPVVLESPDCVEMAQATAERWGLPYQSAVASDDRLVLARTPERLELRELGAHAAGPVAVELAAGAVDHRRRFGGGRGQPIAKAVGLSGGRSPSVVDATAGWGRDAFVLACLGCRVTLIERAPAMAALLEDGLRRAADDPEVGPIVRERMTLVAGDAVDWLRRCGPAECPEVVYLDPMYPAGRGKAAVKKEMRLLRELLGREEDPADLLDVALGAATYRVAVKRPAYAPPLGNRTPDVSFPTKRNRFDVYVIHQDRRLG